MAVAELNEFTQKHRLVLGYEDVGCSGPDHIKTFTVRAVVNGKPYPDGVGKNKKEARLNAATNALKVLLEETIDPKENAAAASASAPQTSISQAKYMCWLNEYSQKSRVTIRPVESTKLGPNGVSQCCCFVVGDQEYPKATGNTKKEAKEGAAKLVYQEINGIKSTEIIEQKYCGTPSKESKESNMLDICEKMKTMSVITKEKGFKETNDGEAKQNAARLACSAVAELTDRDSKVKSPDLKPKIRIAANFKNACRNSKEEEMPNFNGKDPGRSPRKKTTAQPSVSRFTSDFDSIMSLGKGTFGHVFKAEDKLLKKSYAIKIVRCKEIEKSLREVKVLSDLNHCNIVRYYACWLEDSGYQWDSADGRSQSNGNRSVQYLYIQMELCSTRTLRVWIDEKNLQNAKKSLRDSKRRDESLTIAQQIVSAVEYIHSKNLIHRDLKPANLLFGQDGEVKVGDFGLVTEKNDDDAENISERTAYKGTPSYMAPEQRSRSLTYDHKVDIFAFGLIYFELLWNLSIGDERKKIMDNARIQIYPEKFSSSFIMEVKIIKSMLSKKPEDRPEASQLKMDLEECSQTLKDTHRVSRTVDTKWQSELKRRTDFSQQHDTYYLKSIVSLYLLSTGYITLCVLSWYSGYFLFKMESRNYVYELNNYAKTTRSELKFDGFSAGPGHDLTFTQWVVYNGKVYPDGLGKNKKEAKNNAAKNALESLLENRCQGKAAKEKQKCTTAQQKEEKDQTVLDISNRYRCLSVNFKDKLREREVDFISIVAQYCQKTNRCHSYIEVRKCDPAQQRQFFYKLMIDKKWYPEGEGRTVKLAKKNAARLAWSALQEQSDWDSKVSINSTASEDCASPMLPNQLTTQESHESSSESRPTDTGSPIAFPNSPSRSGAQIPDSRLSTASGDGVSDRLSATSSLESLASSQSQSTGTSSSVIFTDSSNSSRDQDAVKVQNSRNSQNETSVPSRFTSDFDPMELLGKGAFGRVYKARHKLLNNVYYAVKVVRCEEKSLREMGTLSELHHCNIVRYYTFWVEDSGYRGNPELMDGAADSSASYGSSQTSSNSSAKYFYIQMELCDTKTLKDWIVEKNQESLHDSKRREEGQSIAQQIVSGVEYIHSKKHIHRDLKPDNILFGLDGEVKIGDFGLVTRDDDDADSALMERSWEKGTNTYMAPEQREKKYDRKVDIFALGLIYFEILWKLSTGHERVVVWNDARSQKLPEKFSQTFPQENQVIELMLHEKPEERPEASELKAKIEICAQIYNKQSTHLANATI
ncbi:uncharacterized protein AB9W97_019141 [Spinachia spinachia]